MIPYLKGEQLDYVAYQLGLIRKRYWLFFRESDKSLRKRLENRVAQLCSSNLISPFCKVERG